MTRRRPSPDEETFREHGDAPAAPPLRPDRPSPYGGLDHTAVGMLLPPPRPDFLPAAVSARVRNYLRRPVWRSMAVLFGVLMVGVVIGLLTTIGQGPVALSRDRLFAGNTPAQFTVAGIFLHNALIAVVPVLLFPILFWGPPATMGLTGFVVGRLAGIWQALHLPNGALILVLVPHGMIEIPSFLLAGTIAWRLGWSSWDSARFGGTWWTRVRAGARVALPLLALVIGALAVAAAIEVKVTPDIVRSVYPDI